MNDFLTVDGMFESQTVAERSRFICYIKGISCEEEAKNFVEEIRKKNSLATHNCYAYISDENGQNEKFSDDGEPQGTAGRPMLDVLKKNGYRCIVAVVTRFFGGVKLGTGGLVRAYSDAVLNCLERATVLRMKKSVFLSVNVDYEGYSAVMRIQKEYEFRIIATDFVNDVTIKVAVENSMYERFIQRIADITLGKANVSTIKQGYYGF